MSNTSQTARLPRVLFLGMLGRFSYISLCALMESGIDVCAVVIPAEQSFRTNLPAIQKREQPQAVRSILPVLHSSAHTSIVQLAWEQNIQVLEVRQLSDQETFRTFETYHPDFICVACFSKRIPPDILAIPPLGCLNVHPSLLPVNRGPEPLFWTFHEGTQRTGVTIHFMDDGMDSGAIVAQEVVEMPDGISYPDLEEQSAELGGTLLAQSVWALYKGVAHPVEQDETKCSYHAFPSYDDFVIPATEWDAHHVYNFICGMKSWGMPMLIHIDNQTIRVKKALSYSHETVIHNDVGVFGKLKEGFWVRCKQGSVLVVYIILNHS